MLKHVIKFLDKKIVKPTTRPWISVLTFCTVVAGWLDASLSSVDKKFLHLRTLSSISLLAGVLGWILAEPPVAADAAMSSDTSMLIFKRYFHTCASMLPQSNFLL